MKMKKNPKYKRGRPVFAVITKVDVEPDGNICDDMGYWGKDKYKGDVVYLPANLPKGISPKKYVHVKRPVFRIGELMVLEGGKYGREMDGRGRKPCKWYVEYKMFHKLERALACSRTVMRKYFKDMDEKLSR